MVDKTSAAARQLAGRLARSAEAQTKSLRRVSIEQLTILRRRSGRGFSYIGPNGRTIDEQGVLRRLKRLAVPPAYEDVRFAQDTAAHIQAVGRDRAGRTQYRYHPGWEQIREQRKARHLSELIRLMPKIRAELSRHLRDKALSREFALAAVIDLIACTAIRPGSEAYAREHGTRGAATLLKSDVKITGDKISLRFRGKGSKIIERDLQSKRLARALTRLSALPGRRLFQYRTANGEICIARRRDVNAFLHEIASDRVSLKDFRTLVACGLALENLANLKPKPTDAGRRRQLKAALEAVSEQLANTPAICRKSYVHRVVVEAFENGKLEALARRVRRRASVPAGERMLRLVLNASLLRPADASDRDDERDVGQDSQGAAPAACRRRPGA
jgi:DNA topoisomerase I